VQDGVLMAESEASVDVALGGVQPRHVVRSGGKLSITLYRGGAAPRARASQVPPFTRRQRQFVVGVQRRVWRGDTHQQGEHHESQEDESDAVRLRGIEVIDGRRVCRCRLGRCSQQRPLHAVQFFATAHNGRHPTVSARRGPGSIHTRWCRVACTAPADRGEGGGSDKEERRRDGAVRSRRRERRQIEGRAVGATKRRGDAMGLFEAGDVSAGR
jgi:hypothetical protein